MRNAYVDHLQTTVMALFAFGGSLLASGGAHVAQMAQVDFPPKRAISEFHTAHGAQVVQLGLGQ